MSCQDQYPHGCVAHQKALDDNWGEGGAARVALHTVVGALGGGLNGALGAGTVAVSTPEVAKLIDGMDVPEPMKQALLMAAGTVIGEVAGGNAGAASGLTEVANNYLNHQQVTDKTKELANCKARGCTAEERNNILQKYQSISDKNNLDGLDDMLTANGSVMPKYELDKEIADLNAMVTGPTACAADLGCRIEVSKNISEIKEIQSAPETIQTFFNTVPNVMLGMTLPIAGEAALEAVGLGSAAKVGVSAGENSGVGNVVGNFSAIEPGPLVNNLAETFSGGRYTTVTLQDDTILYRAGTNGKPLGEFFSLEPSTSVLQTRIDKAILPEWPSGATSPVDTSFAVKIPAGTQVHIGEVGTQSSFYIGGTQQVIVPKPWTIPGVQVINSSPLK